jgi:hypothetical protein
MKLTMGPRTSEVAAKEPPSWIDSAASESEVTIPGFSSLGSFKVSGSVVTWRVVSDAVCSCEIF